MISKGELLSAIDELEDSAPTFQNCQKMATFYTLLNSMYRNNAQDQEVRIETNREEVIGNHGDSEFLQLIEGKPSQISWELMDEVMETIKILQPKLYDSILRRLRD